MCCFFFGGGGGVGRGNRDTIIIIILNVMNYYYMPNNIGFTLEHNESMNWFDHFNFYFLNYISMKWSFTTMTIEGILYDDDDDNTHRNTLMCIVDILLETGLFGFSVNVCRNRFFFFVLINIWNLVISMFIILLVCLFTCLFLCM